MMQWYSSENYQVFRKSATEATSGHSTEEVYDALLRLVLSSGKTGGVLDVGAGIGILTERLLKSGRFDFVIGVDFLTPHPTLKGLPWVRGDLNLGLPFSRGVFQVVVCAEVIEHLENPWAFARNIREVFGKGGVLFLSTPNNASIRSYLSLLLRGYYPFFGPSAYPGHLTALLRVDLMHILRAAGFRKIHFHYTNKGYIPKTQKFWQDFDGGLILRGRLFSDNLLVEAWV